MAARRARALAWAAGLASLGVGAAVFLAWLQPGLAGALLVGPWFCG